MTRSDNFIFTGLVVVVIALIAPGIISSFMSAQTGLNEAKAQAYMQSSCELITNASGTQQWYACSTIN